MSAHEFDQWLAFLSEEPLGPFSELQRHAQSIAAQANGPLSRNDKRTWSAADFMQPRWASPPASSAANQPNFEQIKAQAAAMFRPQALG